MQHYASFDQETHFLGIFKDFDNIYREGVMHL